MILRPFDLGAFGAALLTPTPNTIPGYATTSYTHPLSKNSDCRYVYELLLLIISEPLTAQPNNRFSNFSRSQRPGKY